MPKTITLDEARRLLASHDYEAFLDAVETSHLEFKSEPYRLDQDLQKQELAKDVSALANAGGGGILMGFKTTKDSTVLGDVVAYVRPIPSETGALGSKLLLRSAAFSRSFPGRRDK